MHSCGNGLCVYVGVYVCGVKFIEMHVNVVLVKLCVQRTELVS